MSEAVGAKQDRKQSVGEFVRKTREEMDKTSFPSSQDVRGTTIITLIAVVFFAVYLFLIDRLWTYFLEGLTWLVNRLAGF